jgi:hypothetical protein
MSRLVALILAAGVVFGGAGCSGCPTALLEGVLIADGQGGLAVRGEGGAVTPVVWPGDAHVTRDGDHLDLANTLGFVFAREGEFVRMGGGGNPNGPGFVACGPVAFRPSVTPTQ